MSGNVNVGFIDGRVSSRVLKPPGGGYSDIFNFSQNEDESPKKPPPNRTQSKIESIICTEQIQTKTVEKKDVIEEKIEKLTLTNEEQVEQKVEEVPTEVVAEATKQDEKIEEKTVVDEGPAVKTPEVTPTRKGRVPPGGFSSGLW